ncbi:hypothetical protein SeMB42_g02270 [Synchytrium endobioticum]|uniref:Mitogen-activated protein kinase n=1 Tax=Synchytrium endobioticum TaxID=286115 RepID=A0A507DG59_9FUNG|nr:hypothetical protein SeLEV6574_g02637 [Synchytrium endobioticum]TPX50381.1 hypothetical protein SeMB42_g02270 [Synchytrium endobioticum]
MQQHPTSPPTTQPKQKLPTSLDARFKLIRELGSGAYGTVVAATNLETGQEVAIKKVTKIFDKPILAKRALRELKLLVHFSGHENITSVFDVDLVDPRDFNEIFIVQELMEADLHQIIRSEQPLTEAHFQYFVYQLLRGLKYIHSANVLHRDLKPGNLLVNADCELKICDFGLARGFSDVPANNAGFLTEYVATRWYRAPEIMLSFRSYTKAIDMWSVGCIFAELLGGKPLFRGRDYVDQLNQILAVLGTPDDATIGRVGSARAQIYIRSLPRAVKISFGTLYPNASPSAIDLLERMLQFDPSTRITVEAALAHPYLENYHDEQDEPACNEIFDFGFEALDTMEDMKAMIAREIRRFKQNLAARHRETAPQTPPQNTTPVLNRDRVEAVPREWAELQQPEDQDIARDVDLDSELGQRQQDQR